MRWRIARGRSRYAVLPDAGASRLRAAPESAITMSRANPTADFDVAGTRVPPGVGVGPVGDAVLVGVGVVAGDPAGVGVRVGVEPAEPGRHDVCIRYASRFEAVKSNRIQPRFSDHASPRNLPVSGSILTPASATGVP